MKCAFLCILAISACQAEFADTSIPDMGVIYALDCTEKISLVDSNIHAPIFDVEKNMKIEGLNSMDIAATCTIGQPEHIKYEKQHEAAYDQGEQCYKEQKETKDFKAAMKCCDKIRDALEKQGNIARDQCLACYAKCTKLGPDCKKMIKSTDNGDREKNENKNNDGTKKNRNQDTHGSKEN